MVGSIYSSLTEHTQRMLRVLRLLGRSTNTKNTARDQLANERSFLAYCRVSLCFTVAAITVVQSFNKIILETLVYRLLTSKGKDTSAINLTYVVNDAALFERLQSSYTRIVRPLCLLSLSIALLTALIGVSRYLINLNLLIHDRRFDPANLSLASISICSTSLALATLVYIVTSYES